MKNGCILIENYEVTTCHGVNPEEKVEPQRFLISAKLSLDVSTAAKTDDIDKTVSYSAVCTQYGETHTQKIPRLRGGSHGQKA